MAFTTIDTSGFDSAIASFEAALDAYQNARSVLSNRTNELTNNWKGYGGDKYRSITKSIFKLLDDDGESLVYIIQNLQEIRKTYQEADAKIKGNIEAQEI